jgi:hypothetical protein
MAATRKEFISAESLLRDSFALAVQIVASGFRPTFLVGVWRGGAPIGIAVQEVRVHAIDWLVFPHEVQGLAREEILANKPVDEDFFRT